MNNENIKTQAKQIMDNFVLSLDKIDIKEDFVLERDICVREEREGFYADEEFKILFLNNAKNVIGDSVLANKGVWL